MTHVSHGMPTDSLVYGRRTQQFYPKMNIRTGGAPQRCGGQTNLNITNNYGPSKGIMITNTVLGGIGMLGNLFLGFMGLRRQQPAQQNPYAQLNQQPQNSQMQDLIKQQQKQIDDLKKQIEDLNNKEDPQPAVRQNNKVDNQPQGAGGIATEICAYKGNVTVHDDELGQKGDITGKTTINSANAQSKGFPASIQVGNYNYVFEKVDQDGVAWYKSQQGNGQSYRLEKNTDGTFGLNQHAGDDGVGNADISKYRRSTTATVATGATGATGSDSTATVNNNNSTLSNDNDASLKENLQVKDAPQKSGFTLGENKSGTFTDAQGKTWNDQVVSTTPPYKNASVTVPAAKVAELGGDQEKIKDFALAQIKAQLDE